MRSDQAGNTGQPVRFLYRCIEKSTFPPHVKRHVLQMIRPYTRVYNIPPEHAAASAVFLNAYAQWARWTAELIESTSPTMKNIKKQERCSIRVERWSHVISKCPASKGMISRQNHRVDLHRKPATRAREIPPTQQAESSSVKVAV